MLDSGDASYRMFNNRSALRWYLRAGDTCRGNYEALMKTTRAYLDAGEDADAPSSQALFLQAFYLGDSLTHRFPDSAQSFFLKAVAAGNLARREIGTKRLMLAREIGTNAERAIALDPSFAPAYIVQGVYYREVAIAGTLQTLAANLLLGGMPRGTLQDSRRSLQKAVALSPENIYALLELARTMIAMDSSAQAIYLLEKQQGCPIRWHMDGRLKKEGSLLLTQLRNHP